MANQVAIYICGTWTGLVFAWSVLYHIHKKKNHKR